MFCPECGEVIGAGPLDLRRAGTCERRGMVARISRWIGALFTRSGRARPVAQTASARRRAGGA
ncbi:MAG: hypothetical protein CVT74_08795 [Alphaproteobacteria bacterium HGW-Alphaproteobacteria-13]|jgi:hypothetical protein|nr:MAG: hypothetical protein CVT74_08795 [Alphaproteobacteria bacterium HGW-Alphaproteobacteria-13]